MLLHHDENTVRLYTTEDLILFILVDYSVACFKCSSGRITNFSEERLKTGVQWGQELE